MATEEEKGRAAALLPCSIQRNDDAAAHDAQADLVGWRKAGLGKPLALEADEGLPFGRRMVR